MHARGYLLDIWDDPYARTGLIYSRNTLHGYLCYSRMHTRSQASQVCTQPMTQSASTHTSAGKGVPRKIGLTSRKRVAHPPLARHARNLATMPALPCLPQCAPGSPDSAHLRPLCRDCARPRTTRAPRAPLRGPPVRHWPLIRLVTARTASPAA